MITKGRACIRFLLFQKLLKITKEKKGYKSKQNWKKLGISLGWSRLLLYCTELKAKIDFGARAVEFIQWLVGEAENSHMTVAYYQPAQCYQSIHSWQ